MVKTIIGGIDVQQYITSYRVDIRLFTATTALPT